MRKLNNQGFGLVAVLIAILVVVAVGGTGYLVWHKNHENKATSTASAIAAKEQGSKNDKSPSSQAATKHTNDEAVSAVQSTYSTALAYVQKNSNADQGEINAVKDYLDPSLYAQLTAAEAQGSDHDLMLCSQAFPDSVTASLISSASDAANISVAEVFGSTTNEAMVTINLITLKITNITCAQ